MVNFYIGNALDQNLAKSESCNCCKRSKHVISDNLLKNGYVWETQWTTSSELKTKFDPSLDRSKTEFFKIKKKSWSKNPPLGCNLGQPRSGHLSEKEMTT